jgi:FkbM family methyltransferase
MHPLRKLALTVQVQFPPLIAAKFAGENVVCRATGLLYRKEFGGLRHFNLSDKVIVDIGASHGQSIIAFKNAARRPRIVAFEANPRLAASLASRYAKDPNVQIVSCAIGAEECHALLYEPSYRGCRLDSLGSFDRKYAFDWINGDRIYFYDEKKKSVTAHLVQTRKLDSFKLQPTLIKLSIQRSEIAALEGARETIKIYRPIIVSAWPWPDLIDYLAAIGYSFRSYDGNGFPSGRPNYMNWFLLPEHVTMAQ